MPHKSKLDWALWNAEQGFRVFPIKEDAKYPPLLKRPYEHATTDVSTILDWWFAHPDANIGIDTSDLLVVDIDVKGEKNGYLAAEDLGILDAHTYVVLTPSGGQHRYYRVDQPVAGSVDVLGVGIDTRGYHNYVLAAGSTIPGGHYTRECDRSVAPAPEHIRTRSAIPEVRQYAALVDWDTPSAVALALEYVRLAPPAIEGMGGDDHTYRLAAKLREFGISESVCLDLMLDHWNDTCEPPWEPEHLRQKVAHAYEYAKNQPGSSNPEGIFSGVEVDQPKPSIVRSPWFSHGDDWKGSVRWLYKNTLPTTGVALLTASSQAGKTFVGLHLANSLLSGQAFFGTEPKEKGATIILAAEGFGSIKHRMAALGEPGDRLPISVRSVGGLAARGAWASLCEDVRARSVVMQAEFGMPVRMIVVDTLSASGILDDENDNAKAATVMKAFAELSVALNCLVLVMHHPPKSGHGERGAGAIRNNADYVLEISRDGTSVVRTLEITKSRDADQRSLGSFTLIPKVIGTDEDGETIETMVVSTGTASPEYGKLPAHAEKFLETLDNVLAVPGECDVEGDAVEHDGFRTEWRIATGAYPRRDQRSNAHRAFSKLLEFYVKNMTVEEVTIAGARFIRRRKIEI